MNNAVGKQCSAHDVRPRGIVPMLCSGCSLLVDPSTARQLPK